MQYALMRPQLFYTYFSWTRLQLPGNTAMHHIVAVQEGRLKRQQVRTFAVCLNSSQFAWYKLHITQRARTSSTIKPHTNEVYLPLESYWSDSSPAWVFPSANSSTFKWGFGLEALDLLKSTTSTHHECQGESLESFTACRSFFWTPKACSCGWIPVCNSRQLIQSSTLG